MSVPLLEALAPHPVVAVLRAPTAERFVEVSTVLCEAGIRCLEYTLTTAGALDALREARQVLPTGTLLGVGTIRTREHVEEAVRAGADFLVNQAFRLDLVQAAQDLDVPFVPGALTPTEIVTAWDAGVPAVKVSPIGPLGGLQYLGEVRGPLPDVPLLPTGGVLVEETAAYLEAGAVAVGLSRDLMRDALGEGGDLDGLAERARRAVELAGAVVA